MGFLERWRGIPQKKNPGVVVKIGDIPDDSVSLQFARDIAATHGGTIVITDLNASPQAKQDGLPVTVEPDPQPKSDN